MKRQVVEKLNCSVVSIDQITKDKQYGFVDRDGYKGVITTQLDGDYGILYFDHNCRVGPMHGMFSAESNEGITHDCIDTLEGITKELLEFGYQVFEFDTVKELLEWLDNLETCDRLLP